jgi:gluconolactonase
MKASDSYVSYEPEFEQLIDRSKPLEILYTGTSYSEGPAYFGGGRYLIWSDIPKDRMYRYDETDGSVSLFRTPSHHSNGNTVDRRGRLVTCEHGSRSVTRTEHDGTILAIATHWRGKRLNSPNDVVVRADESIWFTDPPYGIDNNYGAPKAESEIGKNYVFRVDPFSNAIEPVITDMDMPNGLAFSKDERKLYVVDSGRSHGPDRPAHIRAFDVGENGTVSGGDVFAECGSFIFDGLRVDDAGRVWTSAGDGVRCYKPDGTIIGKILTGEAVGNLEFGGGPQRNRLYICCITMLLATNLKINGAG